MALPAGGGGPPSPGGGGGIPPLPDGAAVSPAMDAEFGRRIVLPEPPQVKPLAQFFQVAFVKTSKTTFNNDQQGKKELGKTGLN